MSSEDTNSNISDAPPRAIGLNSITLLVLPIFLVFAFAIALCARELAAHVVSGDGDGTMLTRISATSPQGNAGGNAGYELSGTTDPASNTTTVEEQ